MNPINSQQNAQYTAYQATAKKITSGELNRIETKKSQVDAQQNMMARTALLNASYRDKQKQYVFMAIVLVFTAGFTYLLFFLQKRMGVASTAIEILIIVVVSTGLISSFFIFLDILSRDNIQFNEINSNSLKPVNKIPASTLSASAATLAANAGTCIGADCCGPGFSYRKNTCVRN